jgi:hypothetical protein
MSISMLALPRSWSRDIYEIASNLIDEIINEDGTSFCKTRSIQYNSAEIAEKSIFSEGFPILINTEFLRRLRKK